MKIKTANLTGPALDWAVAKCEGRENDGTWDENFSTNWLLSGPIIERDWIEIVPWPNEHDENMRWRATQYDLRSKVSQTGHTALVAAMRCFVASRLGDDIDVPEELA